MVDFGYWFLPNGQRGRVSWEPATKTLVLCRPGGGPGRVYERLAEFEGLESCRAVLGGEDPWWDHSDERDGLRWLLGRLDTYEQSAAR